jgi:hypothetical protein
MKTKSGDDVPKADRDGVVVFECGEESVGLLDESRNERNGGAHFRLFESGFKLYLRLIILPSREEIHRLNLTNRQQLKGDRFQISLVNPTCPFNVPNPQTANFKPNTCWYPFTKYSSGCSVCGSSGEATANPGSFSMDTTRE